MSKVNLDEIDHQILDILIDNTRIPFTDISKRLVISAGTVHVRVKKMEESGIIKGSSLNLDYVKLGYSFIAYVGIFLENNKFIHAPNSNEKIKIEDFDGYWAENFVGYASVVNFINLPQ